MLLKLQAAKAGDSLKSPPSPLFEKVKLLQDKRKL